MNDARGFAVNAWRCHTCGEDHGELPMHYGAAAPLPWYDVPEAERATRCELNRDQCVIDEEHFFVVGNLELPVEGVDDPFSWDVWVSLSEANFLRACEMWDRPGRESEPPYFGWLSTSLPGYPETFLLKTRVHTREVGRRPRVELEPTDHPLAVEQRTGITRDRVREIAELVRRGPPGRVRFSGTAAPARPSSLPAFGLRGATARGRPRQAAARPQDFATCESGLVPSHSA